MEPMMGYGVALATTSLFIALHLVYKGRATPVFLALYVVLYSSTWVLVPDLFLTRPVILELRRTLIYGSEITRIALGAYDRHWNGTEVRPVYQRTGTTGL